jgi:hypothetical protein
LRPHQKLERGGTDFAILAKAICQSFNLGPMLGHLLTGANLTGVKVRFDFVRRQARVMFQDEVDRYHAITVARMVRQVAFKFEFGL